MVIAASAMFADASASAPRTLAGVTLGAPLARDVVQRFGAEKHPGTGANAATWTWKRAGGGVVTVSTDNAGVVQRIDFTAKQGESDAIDLPCAGSFEIQQSHLNLDFAAEKSACVSTGDAGSYTLPDGSVFEARFEGPGDGQLLEAIWYRPAARV
ncbi:MAG: hypothetical protein JO060_02645 [Candidatus Eremiobacteraeota bacterium]|nr:hypothetical protein [Candidatus Eremiobacteraeota bacterium]MBV9648178.1 hypothetical protein [Candidatus Eremiobacteraeota bacterium]